jgi:hypothetical protein
MLVLVSFPLTVGKPAVTILPCGALSGLSKPREQLHVRGDAGSHHIRHHSDLQM